MDIRSKMRNAYSMQDYAAAKRGLDSLLRQLMDLNPSAARSLEEGLEETLTCIGCDCRPNCGVR